MNIRRIAKESGVSVATVSRILNGKDRVAEGTRKKVLEIIQKYEYVPNVIARNLSCRRSFTIGVTCPHFTGSVPKDTFFPVVISGMEEPLFISNYSLLLIYAREQNIQNKRYFVNLFESQKVDGIVLMHIRKDIPAFNYLEEKKYPYVSIGRISENQRGSYVDTDNVKRTYLAVEHFIERHNFKKIGYIGMYPDYSVYADGLKGYELCNAKYGLKINKNLVYLAKQDTEEEGYTGIQKILKSSPDCLVILGTILFNGVIRYITKHGLKIPDDVRIIHCAEIMLGIGFDTRITQVRQPVFELGRYAVDILLRQIKGNRKKEQVVLNPEFHPGNSCGCSLEEKKYEKAI